MLNLSNVTIVCIDGLGDEIEKIKNIFTICCKEINFFDKKIITSNTNAKTDSFFTIVTIDKISSYQEYQKFCILNLNNYIESDYALFIQTDGFISNPNLWDDTFLNYDYIGAPWIHEIVPNPFLWTNNGTENMVGCGGFSLRSKKFLNACSNFPKEYIHDLVYRGVNEDIITSVVFKKHLENNMNCKFADVTVAKKFAQGSIPFKPGASNLSFGFHNSGYIKETLEVFNRKHNTKYKYFDVCEKE